MQADHRELIRRRLVCRGVVQGVGFRPAVWRLGHELGLAGFVRNDPAGATIEVQGPHEDVLAFERSLPQRLPPLARLREVRATTLAASTGPERAFEVAATRAGQRGDALVPPDVALCPACRAELDDPLDRRGHHPFQSCTDCGPRFSIVRALPYDRERTSMACFSLCARCAAEYADPASRRFHAEPIACPDCGPSLWLSDGEGATLARAEAALALARARLAEGAIVALKGLGGFQLVCRADDAATLHRLRERKGRASKPLALMVRDLAEARRLVRLAPADEELLASPAGPIVLAPRRAAAALPEEVAPGIVDLGLMLPTTALHVELFREAPYRALVATSGNPSEEPLCLGNREALARLAGVADLFLLHDRDILRRVDDSVVRAAAGAPIVLRRSRGFAPAPLALPCAAPRPVLALGGYLQTTACLASGEEAWLSQHVGDLESTSARAFLREAARGLEAFLEREARVLACDLHPDYPSTWLAEEWARERGARLVRVAHHLAHAAAVLGEHGLFPLEDERAAALVLDGTGYGPDGTAWGAELLWLDGRLRYGRTACGAPLPLVGGERAVREPWRIAVAVLVRAGLGARIEELPLAATVERERLAAIAHLAARPSSHWPAAHGAGRLFEAAGALLGLCPVNGYEGEAAARLEAAASSAGGDASERWPEVRLAPRTSVLPQAELLVAAARRVLADEPIARIASGLHATYAALWVDLVRRRLPGLERLALGGGCAVNRLLVAALERGLARQGCALARARELPPGDGGLAYGQALVAAAALARGTHPLHLSAPPGTPGITTHAEAPPCAWPSPCS